MTRAELWLTLVVMGVVTLALRASFLLLPRARLPGGFERALRFVPSAVLAALVAPALFAPGAGETGPLDPRLVAAALAALIAWRTKSVALTIVAGMAALWTLRALV